MTLQNRRIVKHFRTTGETAPAVSALTQGEIAVAMDNNSPQIFFKKNNGQIANFIDETRMNGKLDTKLTQIEPGEGITRNGNTIDMLWATPEHIESLFFLVLFDPKIKLKNNKITITCETSGVNIYYRLNQTGSYVLYSEPIPIESSTFVETYSTIDDLVSNVVYDTCEPKITGLSISGETNVIKNAVYTAICTPSGTTETGVTWYVMSGGQYATIDSNTGILSVLSGASGNTVVIRAISNVNSAITDEKTINVTYVLTNAVKFTAKANNSTVGLTNKSSYQTLEYSVNGGLTWINMTTATTITLTNSDDSVYVRGVLSNDNTALNYTQFKMSGNIKASGNINTLWNKNNPDTALKQYCGCYLFSGCTALTDVSELQLPATTLANSCYEFMFGGCTSLTTAPELPATTLENFCYQYMFRGCTSLTTAPSILPATGLTEYCYMYMFLDCTSLTTAPVLHATTLASSCYMGMFYGCSSLTTAPELPATTLGTHCYADMFADCTSLTTAPELPATTLASHCYYTMFQGCTSLTTAPKLPATGLASHCYAAMFQNCTSLTTAPTLQATTLADGCYDSMFQGCRSLITAPALSATTLASYCYYNMFASCTSLTTAPELQATTLTEYCYCYMFNSCTNLNYIKCLATNISATDCTYNWVKGVASSGTFVKNASMTGWTTGVNGIPTGWVVEDNPVPLQSISISGETNVENSANFSVIYIPSDTTETGVTWSIVSGGEYASINSTTGKLTVLSGASSSAVVIKTTSIANSAITDTKTLSVTYLPLQSLSISGETDVKSETTYTVIYSPSSTLETGVTWSIVSGSEYASIDSTTGVLTVLEGASGSTVVIKTTSIVDSGITAEKTLTVTYVELPAVKFTAKQSNSTIGLVKKSSQTLQYSGDGNTWNTMTTTTTITLSTIGDAVYIRGVLSSNNTWSNCTQFKMTGNIKVSGNLNYLWNKDNPDAALKQYCGCCLFWKCTALTDVSELVLPSTTLATSCYTCLFADTSITQPPILSGTTLAEYCYNSMFSGCTSLTTAPELPATTLASGCYQHMFKGCINLTTAPELPATTISYGGYLQMFYGCTNLNYIKCLATSDKSSINNQEWVSGVSSTGTFVKKSGVSWTTGINGIPSGWTVQDV